METESKEKFEENFKPLAIAKLLTVTGKYHFVIPSFQRGYRWEEKQVKDLLEDIQQFADDTTKKSNSYFLQPIVVKPGKEERQWEVLDGQQRLTTMLLLLKELLNGGYTSAKDVERYSNSLFDITYISRPQLNFNNPNPEDNIDSFYLSEARKTIKEWCSGVENFHNIIECLFYQTSTRQVKIIWYATNDDSKEIEGIKIFNRLNKGKISLTSSELIKALFIMDCDIRGDENKGLSNEEQKLENRLSAKQLSMEWNEMERQFQNDEFWYFISDDNGNTQTRIDVLFDFVTWRDKSQDTDYSYREFQKLYDSTHISDENNKKELGLWAEGIKDMQDAWLYIKRTFDRMVAWYEDNLYYHYVGYLVSMGCTPLEIYKYLEGKKKEKKEKEPSMEWTIDDTEQELSRKIMESFKKNKTTYLTKDEIGELEYGSEYIVRLLLLFNVECCRKGQSTRFAFDRYKKERWDVEHVNSQNDATLQKFDERMDWLKNVEFILKRENSEASLNLARECKDLMEDFNNNRQVNKNKYIGFYQKINDFYTKEDDEEKIDSIHKEKNFISNLTLLDSSTNREYQDAPFAYKRHCIIKYDKEGKRFIPLCTRNLFLKYYTDSDKQPTQFENMRWSAPDRKCYLDAIHNYVDHIFDAVIKEEKGDNP